MLRVLRMVERGGDLLLGQTGSVVANDQERGLTALIEVPRPTQRIVEGFEFLVERLPFFQGQWNI